MEVKRKILALYEFDDEEKERQMKNQFQLLAKVDEEDQNEKNQTYINMKQKIRKIIKELDQQEEALQAMNKKMLNYKSKKH